MPAEVWITRGWGLPLLIFVAYTAIQTLEATLHMLRAMPTMFGGEGRSKGLYGLTVW